MRLGLVVPQGHEQDLACAAEQHGLFGVYVGLDDPYTAITSAVYASTATEFVRVVVAVRLGLAHPVTVAEELAVLDNVNNGRTIVAVDAGELEDDAAFDEVEVLREALASKPLSHEGVRWKVPARLPANPTAPSAISVTPKPPQVEIPFWVAGTDAAELCARLGLPSVARMPDAIQGRALVQPGVASVDGDVATGRELVKRWADAGATHVFLEFPASGIESTLTVVSRYLAPEAAMPHFPRVMSDSRVPLPWPGEDGKAS